MIRRTVAALLGLLALAVAVAGTYYAVNAFDEELTPEARDLLQPLVLEPAGADNAWQAGTAFRELPDNKPHEAWLRWYALQEAPLRQAGALQPTLQWLLIAKAPLHAHYRAVRALPRYGESLWPSDPITELPVDGALIDGSGLALAEIALAALDGRLGDAVAELEREAAHHRRALAGSRTVLGKLIACSVIVRDMSVVSDLLDMHGEKLRPHRERLMRVVAPIPRADLDLSAVFEIEARVNAQSLLHYRRLILDENETINRWMAVESRLQRWEAFGYRSQATVNEFARRHRANREHMQASYARAWEGRDFPERPAAAPRPWHLVNPTGYAVLEHEAYREWGERWVRRVKDVSALVALVRLQATLTLDEAARRAFLRDAGRDPVVVLDEPFKSRAAFDRHTSSIRYKPWETLGAIGELARRFGGELVVPAGARREAR
jgi:hypothetical protein